MDAYVSGDRQAFSTLFRRLAPKIHGFFVRRFTSTTVADDLLQITFTKVHAARVSYKSGLRVKPWVFGIAARVRLDELRRRYRLPSSTDEDAVAELVGAEDDPGAHLDADRIAERVRAAVAKLPEGQRVVVLLHRFEGLTFAEIATALGLEEGAVRVRAFRAYGALRNALADLAPIEEAAS